MSFMKGFGEGFSKSFEQAASKRADKEAEVMRYTFQNYLDRRKVKEEREAEEAKNISTAKKLTSLYGAPEDAYHTVKSMIEAGMETKDIIKEIRTGKWTQRNDANPVVKAETEASGMAAPTPNASPETPSNPWSTIKDKLLGPRRTPQDKAFDQISGITGQSREEIDQTMAPSAPTPEPESNVQFTPAPLPIEPDPIGTADDAMLEVNNARAALEDDPENPDLIERYTRAQERVKTFDADNQSDWQRDRERKLLEAKDAAALKAQTEPDPYNTPVEADLKLRELQRIDAANSTPETRKAVEIAKERLDSAVHWEQFGTRNRAREKAMAEGLAPPDGSQMWAKLNPQTGMNEYRRLTQQDDGSWLARNPDGTVEKVDINAYRPVGPKEFEDNTTFAKRYSEPVSKYLTKKGTVLSVANHLADMDFLITATDGRILASTTMDVVEFAVKTVQNLNVAVDLLTEGEYNPAVVDRLDAAIEREMGKLIDINGKIQDVNTARALLDTKAKLVTYQMANLVGAGEGRAVSNLDFTQLQEVAKGGTTPEQFRQIAASFLLSEVDDLKYDERRILEEDIELQNFRNIYGGLPFNKPKLWDDEVADTKSNPKLKALMEKFESSPEFGFGGLKPKDKEKTESEEDIPLMTSPEEAAKLPSRRKFKIKTEDGQIKIKVRP